MSPYDRIRRAIIDGTFQPGVLLTESALGAWVGTSRTPVREALGRLEQDGLISRTGRGIAVIDRTPEEILDVYEAWIALEVTAARVAAVRHGLLDRGRLERLTEASERVDRRDARAMVDVGSAFHRAVWQASCNRSLIDLLERLHPQLLRHAVTASAAPARWDEALAEHRAMVVAITDRDPERAGEATERHVRAARDVHLAMWEQGST
ncbi:GntR family transcriptional regulator [Blastococcus sp. CT_GayMR20]|uniref:GntR family transcriptional regulator n=1 Tax=Blastococcus sp. CT_GayMR20 TaxID=2559609 RepID=UPI001073B112|nr:GntR family transcriptional regulator [Blastococcus sp. CT_GayMR20]TFV83100.1 GntR family transcriptional regulator [Blastococcus sp. CT_GayMR20]